MWSGAEASITTPAVLRALTMSGDLELRITDGGMRWKVQPVAIVEVWRDMVLVGTMSGAALCLIVEHHLVTAALQAALTAEFAAPEDRKPLAEMRGRPPIILPAERQGLRAKRRKRR